jgi:hypothetical protein
MFVDTSTAFQRKLKFDSFDKRRPARNTLKMVDLRRASKPGEPVKRDISNSGYCLQLPAEAWGRDNPTNIAQVSCADDSLSSFA